MRGIPIEKQTNSGKPIASMASANHIAHALLSVSSTKNLRNQTKGYLTGFKLQTTIEECFDEVYFTIKPFRKWSDMFEEISLSS